MSGRKPAVRRVVAIDGPAASGKSTTAAAVARRLGFVHLNSGLLYRAFTWRTLAEGWDETGDDYAPAIASVRIDLEPCDGGLRVLVDGEGPGDALHGADVAARVSSVASVEDVREAVLARLRAAGRQFDLVCDGRDIGTTVFPEAALKIFLVARPEERARRRLLESGVAPTEARIAEQAERLERRDRADSTRALSPLRRAPDAVEIDTTDSSPQEVVDAICRLALERGLAAPGESG